MKKIFGMPPFGLVQTAKRLILCIVVLHVFTIQASAAGITVITIAGSREYSSTDGSALAAGLADPIGIAVDNAGAILFTQAETTVVRKVTLDKKVITIAGKIRRGHKDSTIEDALFKEARAIAAAKDGTIYVGDHTNVGIRKISPDGMVSTVAGPMHGRFIDIKPHEKSYWIGIQFSFDPKGNIYVSDSENHCIRVIKPDGMVRTIAGTPGKPGFADGPGKAAQFNGPRAIAFDGEGNLVVADLGNNRIKKIILP